MSKLDELLTKLQQDGLSEDQITVILAEITKAATTKLYTQLVTAVDEKDRQFLEETVENDEEETSQLLDAYYQKYYDIPADQAVDELQEQVATTFLANYDAETIRSQL